jgi:hypothetical protein
MNQNSYTAQSSTALFKDIVNLNWHHLVATYDGSAFKFYVNGVLAGSSYSRALPACDVTALYNQ